MHREALSVTTFILKSEVDLGTSGLKSRVRQSPDWRFAGRHSGEWRSRVCRHAYLSLNSQVEPISNTLSNGFSGLFCVGITVLPASKRNHGNGILSEKIASNPSNDLVHFAPVGTRRFNSSNQFNTTLICVGADSV